MFIMSSYKHLIKIVLLVWLVACTGNESDGHVDSKMELVMALSSVEGQYIQEEGAQSYSYSGLDKLHGIVGSYAPVSILPTLVDCLDDMSETRSSLNGKSVARGVVCYEALSLLVYYEPTAASGDIAKEWPGHIGPTASEEQLIAAKKAWQQVVKEKSYMSL